MAIVKYDSIEPKDVRMDEAARTAKANVIGPAEGWQDHSMRLFRIGPGGHTPCHRHDWEHVIHITRGKGRLTISSETFELARRDFAFVPPNKEHQFENPYDEEFEFICIVPIRGDS